MIGCTCPPRSKAGGAAELLALDVIRSTDGSQDAAAWVAEVLAREVAAGGVREVARPSPTMVSVHTTSGTMLSISVGAYVDDALARRRAALTPPVRAAAQLPAPMPDLAR